MAFESFVTRRGFTGDPFSSTNSETEERLSDYFVPPPYFASVIGTPSTPKSNVILAPRGSGKTAQRRMIEQESAKEDSTFLCLTYDNFDHLAGGEATLLKHQLGICRLLTVALLSWLEQDTSERFWLSEHQKQVLKVAGQTFLSGLNQDEYRQAFGAVKTFGDKTNDLWHKYGGVVAVGVAALMVKAGIDGVNIPKELTAQTSNPESSARYFYTELVSIVQTIGWESVYFLVDKVDETPTTTDDPEAAWALIANLVTDLPTIEQAGVGFKFFLWDQTSDFFSKFGRPDRINTLPLKWTIEELSDMLSRRLQAFSNGKVVNFNDLLEPTFGIDVHRLLAHLCNGSPRDMIRMAAEIVSEQTRKSAAVDHLTEYAVYSGILAFSKKRSRELFPQYDSDFSKISEASFTINKLASDVYRISENAARGKVQKWTTAGAVEKVDELPNGKNRPIHLYAFRDFRIVLARGTVSDLPLYLDSWALECNNCQTVAITSRNEAPCLECGSPVRVGSARGLLSVCSRTV
ncbi:P-loop ATPase, Sll1717 family [Arthrobacter sp. MMS24-T111]